MGVRYPSEYAITALLMGWHKRAIPSAGGASERRAILFETSYVERAPYAEHVDYSGFLDCPIGEKIRPSPGSTVTFEFVGSDFEGKECEFRLKFDEGLSYRGFVRKGDYFEFCSRLRGIRLTQFNSTNACL